MVWTREGRVGARWARLLVWGLLLLSSATVQAQTAPPPNDDIEDATVVGEVPFRDTVDTTGATTDVSPPDPSDCVSPSNTVWYAFTPTVDGRYAVAATGPTTGYAVAVYTGTPGDLTLVACAARLTFEAEAGVTYFIMVAVQEGSTAGELDFVVYRPLELAVLPGLKGSVSKHTGEATVSGTLTCSEPVLSNSSPGVCLCGELSQTRRGTTTVAQTCFCGDCVGELPFTLTFSSPDGPFQPGPAFLNDLTFFGCTEFDCFEGFTFQPIILRGGR